MSDDQTISNDSPMHKYFTMMLNMAEDDLDPYTYRLLAHYIRWTGHGGLFIEGIRTTAERCKMNARTIRKARDELAEKGYVKVVPPVKKGGATQVFILDKWADNIQRYHTESNTENSKCSKSTTPGVADIPHIEEHIEEPSKKDSAPPENGAVSKTDKPYVQGKASSLITNDPEVLEPDERIPSPAKAKTERPRDVVYDAIAFFSFRINDTRVIDKITGKRIGIVSSWLKKQDGIQQDSETSKRIAQFYAWYDKTKNGIARPKDVTKFAEAWTEWQALPARPKPLDINDPLPPEPVYPGRVERDPYALPLEPLTDDQRAIMEKYGLTEDDVS